MLHLLIVALVAGAASQDAPPDETVQPDRRWTVTVSVGRTPGSATGSIERAMRNAGFDQPIAVMDWSPPLTFPASSHGGLAWLVSVHYRIGVGMRL